MESVVECTDKRMVGRPGSWFCAVWFGLCTRIMILCYSTFHNGTVALGFFSLSLSLCLVALISVCMCVGLCIA